jgi:hypothetical protein
MQAIRQIKKPHGNKVTVDIPTNFKTNMVEIIILPIETESNSTKKSSKKKSLLAYLDALKTKELKKRTKKSIDNELAAQQDSWD